MDNKTKMLLGGVIVLGLGYYLYNMKNKSEDEYNNAIGVIGRNGSTNTDGRTGLKGLRRLFG